MAKRDVQRRIDVVSTASKSGVAFIGAPGGGTGSGMVVHGLVSAWHTGSLMDFTEYVTHLNNVNAHHNKATGGSGVDVTDQQAISVKLDDQVNHPGLEFVTSKLHVGLAGGLYAAGGAIGLGTPAGLSASTTNSVATGERGSAAENGHSHQVLAYADGITYPGQLLKTDTEGDASIRELTTNKVLGPNDLHLQAGNMITVNQTQIIRSVDPDLTDQVNLSFSPAFPIRGWQINPVTGVPGQSALTIGAIQADELFVRIFVANETRVDRGEFYISKSYGFLAETFTTGIVGGAPVRIYFEDSPAFEGGRIFADNHWIMFQIYDDSGGGLVVTKVWGQVSGYRDEDPAPYNRENQQSYLFTLRAGPAGYTLKKGSFAVGWGASGQAIIKFSAVDVAGNPYMKLTRWQTVVVDGVPHGPYAPAAHTDLVHVGALSASSVAHQGDYGLVLSDGGDQSVEVSEVGIFLTNANIISSDGTNRTVEILPTGSMKLGKNVLSALNTGFSFDAATGNVIIGQPAGQKILWNGTDKTLSISAVVTILPSSSGFGDFIDANLDNVDDGTEYGRIKTTIIRNGEIQVSTGTYNTKDTNLRGWNIGVGEIVGQYDGVDQVVLNTLGQVTAGAGSVMMSATGLDLAAYQLTSSHANQSDNQKAVAWWDNISDRSGAPLARIYGTRTTTGSGSIPTFEIQVDPGNVDPRKRAMLWLESGGGSGPALWFDRIYNVLGLPGIAMYRDYNTNAESVQVIGGISFRKTLEKDALGTTVDIGTSGRPFDTVYATNVVASTITGTVTGTVEMSGQTWQYDSGHMYIRSDGSAARWLYLSNAGTGAMGLDVEGDIVVGGTVDSVDILAFKGLYDAHIVAYNSLATAYSAHAADTNIHHDKAHAYDSVDHTGTLSWAKVNKTGSSLVDLAAHRYTDLTDRAHNIDGVDHTGTLSWAKVSKTGSSLAHLETRLYTDLTSRTHAITGLDHSVTAADAWYVVGTTAANTLGLLESSDAPGAAAKLLRSTPAGGLTLQTITLGVPDLTPAQNMLFTGHAVIAARRAAYLLLDSDANNTGACFVIAHEGETPAAATELFRFTDTGRLGIGESSPSYSLHVAGTAYASVQVLTPIVGTASGNLTLDPVGGIVIVDNTLRVPTIDTASGNLTIQPAGDLYLSPAGSDVIVAQAAALRSDNFEKTLLTQGFRIGPTSVAGQTGVQAGSGEFDELRVRVFVADETRIDRGQEFLTKSYAILSRDFTVPGSLNGTANIYFENSPHIPGALFTNGDWVMLGYLNMDGGIMLTKVWGTLTGYNTTGLTGEQRWTFTLKSGTGGLAFPKGSNAVNFGASGQGYILSDAVTATSPSIIIARWTGADPFTPANHQTLTAVGKLDAVTFTGEYGLAASVNGYGVDDPYIKVSTAGAALNNLPLVLTSGGEPKVYIGAWDNVWMGPSSTNKLFEFTGTALKLQSAVLVGPQIANMGFATDAEMYCAYDGVSDYLNTSGNLTTHLGHQGTASGGVIFRPGRFGKAVQIDDATTNLIANPSFEGVYVAGVAPGWSAYFNGDALGNRAADADSLYGSKSQKLTRTAGTGSARFGISTTSAAIGATSASMQVAIKVLSYTEGAVVRLHCDFTGGPAAQVDAHTIVPGDVGRWIVLRVQGSVVDATDTCSFFVWIQNANASILVDAAQVEPKPYCTSYCDGSLGGYKSDGVYYPGGAGYGHAWSGTAHASTSSRSAGSLTYPSSILTETRVGTVMAWVNVSNIATQQSIFRLSSADAATHIILRLENGRVRGFWGNTGPLAPVADAITPGTWNHIAVTFDGTTARVYLNGLLKASATPSSAFEHDPTRAIYVGRFGSSDATNGLIDDLAVISRALSDDDIAQVYASQAPLRILSSPFELQLTGISSSGDIRTVSANSGGIFASVTTSAATTASFGLFNDARTAWGGFDSLEAGDIVMGHNRAAAGGLPNSAALFFDRSAGSFGFYGSGGTTPNVEILVDGSIGLSNAGTPWAKINKDGISLVRSTINVVGKTFDWSQRSGIEWYKSAVTGAEADIFAFLSAYRATNDGIPAANYLFLSLVKETSIASEIKISVPNNSLSITDTGISLYSTSAIEIYGATGVTISGNAVWHAGNTPKSGSGARWGVIPLVSGTGQTEIGRYLDFHNTSEDTSNFSVRLDTNLTTTDLYLNGNQMYHAGNLNMALYAPISNPTFTTAITTPTIALSAYKIRSDAAIQLRSLADTVYQQLYCAQITSSGSVIGTGLVSSTGNIYSDSPIQLKTTSGSVVQHIYAGAMLVSNDYTHATRIPNNGIYSLGGVSVGVAGAMTGGYMLDVNGAVRIRSNTLIEGRLRLIAQTQQPAIFDGEVETFVVQGGLSHQKRFVIAYKQDATTTKYRWVDLDSTTNPVIWNYSTSWTDVTN